MLTNRAPSEGESADMAYGLELPGISPPWISGRRWWCRATCVAVEAMEGTDETITRRAHRFRQASLVVIKVSKPKQICALMSVVAC